MAGVLVCGYGHDEGVEQEVSVFETVLLCLSDDTIDDLNAIFCCLWYAVLRDGQAEDRRAVLLCQRKEFLDALLLGTDGIDEGASRICSESGFKSFGITGINSKRCIGDLGHLANGIVHCLDLIDAADAHVDIEEMCARTNLIDGFALDGEEGTILDFFGELLAARRIDAFADQCGRQILVDDDSLAAACETQTIVAGLALGRRQVLDGSSKRSDMCGRRAAAAAEICRSSSDELRAPRGEFLRTHGEDGSAIFQPGHARVGQDADGNRTVLCERLDDGDEFLRAERAVHANDVSAERFQGDGGRLRIRARDGASVLAVGKLADDGKFRCILGRQEACAHFLYVDACLEDQAVCTCIGKRF